MDGLRKALTTPHPRHPDLQWLQRQATLDLGALLAQLDARMAALAEREAELRVAGHQLLGDFAVKAPSTTFSVF